MTASEKIGTITAALAKAQARIKPAIKDSANPFFKSSYADLASVVQACRAALSENEIAVVQLPSCEGANVSVTTMLAHSSGEWLSCTLTSTAKDAGPQSVGSAITYLRRYGLMSMAGVYADDDDDGEAAHGREHQALPRRQTPPPAKSHALEPGHDVPAMEVPSIDPVAAMRKKIAACTSLGKLLVVGQEIKGLSAEAREALREDYAAKQAAIKDAHGAEAHG